eukprot:Gb_09323 [translate_table: standard]
MSDDQVEVEEEATANGVGEKMFNNRDSSSSSSDSDEQRNSFVSRLFGKEKSVHRLLGGGKPADILLWKEKKTSASVVGGATLIWILFEQMEYHLLTLICHILILSILTIFLWSYGAYFLNRTPPRIPEIKFSEETFLNAASALRVEANRFSAGLHDVASGRHLKKFVLVIASLWILSVVGSCYNFLTLLYIGFMIAHTVPVLYEKYGDGMDSLARRAGTEMKKQYEKFDATVLRKIPRGPIKQKKHK